MDILASGNKLSIPQVTSDELEQKYKEPLGGIANMIPGGMLLSTAQTEKFMHDRLETTSLRFLQINMIWMLVSMYLKPPSSLMA